MAEKRGESDVESKLGLGNRVHAHYRPWKNEGGSSKEKLKDWPLEGAPHLAGKIFTNSTCWAFRKPSNPKGPGKEMSRKTSNGGRTRTPTSIGRKGGGTRGGRNLGKKEETTGGGGNKCHGGGPPERSRWKKDISGDSTHRNQSLSGERRKGSHHV